MSRKFKTLTQAQRKLHAKLIGARSVACNDVYAAVLPRTDVRFSDCLCVTAQAIRERYNEARKAVENFEDDMVSDGRAWRATFGMFTPY